MPRFAPRSFLPKYAIRREKWRDVRDKQGYRSRSTWTVATCIYLVFIRHKFPPPTCSARRDRQGCIISLMARLCTSRGGRVFSSLFARAPHVRPANGNANNRQTQGEPWWERRAVSFTPLFDNNEFLVAVPPPGHDCFLLFFSPFSHACEAELYRRR